MSAGAALINILKQFQDKLTKQLIIVNSDQSYIHEGIGFVVTGISGSISAGASYKFSFTTPDINDPDVSKSKQKYIHWRPVSIGGTDAGFSYRLHKNSTSVSDGSPATIQNKNQNSKKISKMQNFLAGATVTEGTQIQGFMAGNLLGGESGADSEIILEPNKQYTITITNESAATASTFIYEFMWFEQEGFEDL